MVKTLPENYQSPIYGDNCNIIDSSEDSELEISGSESNDECCIWKRAAEYAPTGMNSNVV
jgi:hypothetical protein